MSIAPPETETQQPPLAAAIPNFREEERIFARYESMLERRIKTFGMDHESSIRRNASTKRDDLRHALDTAQTEHDRCAEVAAAAREAYRAAFPEHVKKTRLVEPSMIENVRSLGAAKKLYAAAHEAWLAAEHAMSGIRKLEHNEMQLDVELQRALERAPQVSKEVTESEKWLAEIHAEEDLAAIKVKVDDIVAERDSYALRLAAGSVSAEELRLRAFAQAGIKHIAVPASGLLFMRVEQYGSSAYFILRDLRKQLYALPYDRRLEALLDGVFDIEKATDGCTARRSSSPNSALGLSVRDHFAKCNDNDDAVQAELQSHRNFIKESRMLAATAGDESETAAIAALIALISDR